MALILASRLHLPVQGLRHWGLAYLLLAVGLAASIPRGIAPPAMTIVLSNALIAGGYGLGWLGTRRLAGLPARPWPVIVAMVVTAIGMQAYVTDDGIITRVAIASFVTAVLSFMTAQTFSHATLSRTLLGRLLAGLFLCNGAAYLIRGGVAVAAHPEAATFPPGLLGAPILVMGFVVIILVGFGLIVLTSEIMQEELTRQATRDPLTDLFNRRAFNDAAERELSRARRNGRMPAFLLLDLDHFKRLNDTHGHEAGDSLLRAFARTAATGLRPGDVLARFGGEEFVLMLPETDAADAGRVAERIRAGTETATVAGTTGAVSVTVSIGIAVAEMADGGLDSVLRRADAALYAAKAAGRNRIEFAAAPP
ncbi:MAG: GGDEF domain-containing protein [Caenispirillum sp.]|nr:GGDEF domain-containing protein [Caenispirillum sp.]